MSLMFREMKTNDISDGAKYNTHGIHGTGLVRQPVADRRKKTVFEEKTLTPEHSATRSTMTFPDTKRYAVRLNPTGESSATESLSRTKRRSGCFTPFPTR